MSIIVKDLVHVYNEGLPFETTALDGVSFEIDDNEFVGIIGHTGSGKSTLIQHIDGLLKPKSGSIIVDGVDITAKDINLREIRRRIGLVFQYPEYQLFEETVAKDVAFGPANLGLDEAEINRRVRDALSAVGMEYEEFAERSPFELSGGQQRRIAIAGVIAMEPAVLILDEPTAGLDPKTHKEILKMIKELQEKRGIIVILVSHNMGDIAVLSDKVLVMDKGRLLLCGTPHEVFKNGELLTERGLGLPPAAELLMEMKKRGADVSADALSVDEAEREILKFLGKGQEDRND